MSIARSKRSKERMDQATQQLARAKSAEEHALQTGRNISEGVGGAMYQAAQAAMSTCSAMAHLSEVSGTHEQMRLSSTAAQDSLARLQQSMAEGAPKAKVQAQLSAARSQMANVTAAASSLPARVLQPMGQALAMTASLQGHVGAFQIQGEAFLAQLPY